MLRRFFHFNIMIYARNNLLRFWGFVFIFAFSFAHTLNSQVSFTYTRDNINSRHTIEFQYAGTNPNLSLFYWVYRSKPNALWEDPMTWLNAGAGKDQQGTTYGNVGIFHFSFAQNPDGIFIQTQSRTHSGGQDGPWSYTRQHYPSIVTTYCVKWFVMDGNSEYATMIDYDHVTDYEMRQNGEVIHTQSVPVGTSTTVQKSGLTSDAPVQLWATTWTRPYKWDESRKVFVSAVQIGRTSLVDTRTPLPDCSGWDGQSPTNVDTLPPTEVANPVNPASPKPPPSTPPNLSPTTPPPAGSPAGTPPKSISGSVWNSTGSNLDASTYIEGVGKVEKQLIAINDKLSTSGATGGGTGTPSANDQAVSQAAAAGASATNGSGNGQGEQAAKTQVNTAFSSNSIPSLSLSSGAPSMLLTIPNIATINLDPSSEPLISSAANFIKAFITWGASIIFAWFCWSQFSIVVNTLIHSEQARGNPIIGGTGAQATALIAAAAITAILIAVPLAFWAFATYTISPPPTGSGPTDIAMYLLFLFVPISYLLGLLVAAFAVKKAAIVLIAGTATLIRFVVP